MRNIGLRALAIVTLLISALVAAPFDVRLVSAMAAPKVVNIATAYTTAYTWFDNTPPGSGQLCCGVIHQTAGGTGTYADPITLAVGHSTATGQDVLDYPAGTRFYMTDVRRYFMVEDSCGGSSPPQSGGCHNLANAPSGATTWVDMWAGGTANDSQSAAQACSSKLTDSDTPLHTIVEDPPSNLAVVPGPLFQNGQCTDLYGSVPPPPSPPGQPTRLSPVAGNARVDLSWTAPFDGGSPITGYRVTAYKAGIAQTPILTGTTTTSHSFTGLTNWVAYTFAVAAINSLGTGPDSARSTDVTPAVPLPLPTWSTLGGVLNSGPAVTSWSGTHLDVFARGADNALWHRSWDSPTWTTWGSLGGVFVGDPAAISRGLNKVDVFVRGVDNALWTTNTTDGGAHWSGLQSLGGVLASGPEVASWNATHLDVFVRGADNALWKTTWDGANPWTGWSSLGGSLNGDPMAVSAAPNTIDAFVRGADNGLWQNTFSTSAWSGWHSLGGVLASSADAAACNAGHLDVIVRGADNHLWHKGYTGISWTTWQTLGGVFTSDSGSVCRTTTTTVEIMGRGGDNALWEGTITGS